MSRDRLYSTPFRQVPEFQFDEKVVAVFPDMIQRSVPGYTTFIQLTGVIAGRYAQANSNLYDLGCSLGASTFAMQQQVQHKNCRIIAVDSSSAMLEQFKKNLTQEPTQLPIETHCKDITKFPMENASVVVLNFTLQFIAIENRLELLRKIYQSLLPGGVFVLSEKIMFNEPSLQASFTGLHHAFKQANGYSQLEISQKRTAIENILQPETLLQHQERIAAAGFYSQAVWFQCLNFASLIAWK